jgi:hypothetical protein
MSKKPSDASILEGDEEVWELVKQKWPAKYLELKIKRAALRMAAPPSGDVSDCKTGDELGRLLIQSVAEGIDPDAITANMIKRALAANDRFVDDLEKIAGVQKHPERKGKHGNGNNVFVDEAAAMLKHIGYD